MQKDEQAIRELVDTWLKASKAGDVAKVLTLMSHEQKKPDGSWIVARDANLVA